MQVSINTIDKIIAINGEALQIDFQYFPPSMRAMQWNGASGTVEFETGANQWFDNVAMVQPYIDAWNAEKARILAEEQAAAGV